MNLLRLLLGSFLLTFGASVLGVTTYAYDASKRLISVSYDDSTQIRYGYDAAGNIVSRRVGRVGDPVGSLDIDGSGPPSTYDPLTDGLLNLRYLFGLRGLALTNGALGGTATRLDGAAIKAYLDDLGLLADIDGNGRVEPLLDGLLIIRYLFGLRGAPLIANAVDPVGATRKTAAEIEAYIRSLMP